MFSTWGSTQEVGWVRHAFDTFEVPYDLIYKERIRQGDLRAAYDVILIPNQGRARQVAWCTTSSARASRSPIRKTAQFPTLGIYGESDDITGGMGLEGVLELQKFVEERRRADHARRAQRTCRRSSACTRSVNAAAPVGAFYAPGPIVQAEILRPKHPIFFGYRDHDGPGALRQRPAAPGAGGRRDDAGADAVHGRRRRRAQRPDAGRRRNPATGRPSSTRRSARAASCCSPPTPAIAGRTTASSGCCSTRGAVLERPAGEPRRRAFPVGRGPQPAVTLNGWSSCRYATGSSPAESVSALRSRSPWLTLPPSPFVTSRIRTPGRSIRSTTTTARRSPTRTAGSRTSTAPRPRRGSRRRTRSPSTTSSRSPAREPIRERLTTLWNYRTLRRPRSKRAGATSTPATAACRTRRCSTSTTGLEGRAARPARPQHALDRRHGRARGRRGQRRRQAAGLRLATAGSDWNEWRVRDVDTGKDLARRPQVGQVLRRRWTKDGKGFFYSRYDEPRGGNALQDVNYFQKLYYHRLGTPQADDVLVYDAAGPARSGASAARSPRTAST